MPVVSPCDVGFLRQAMPRKKVQGSPRQPARSGGGPTVFDWAAGRCFRPDKDVLDHLVSEVHGIWPNPPLPAYRLVGPHLLSGRSWGPGWPRLGDPLGDYRHEISGL